MSSEEWMSKGSTCTRLDEPDRSRRCNAVGCLSWPLSSAHCLRHSCHFAYSVASYLLAASDRLYTSVDTPSTERMSLAFSMIQWSCSSGDLVSAKLPGTVRDAPSTTDKPWRR